MIIAYIICLLIGTIGQNHILLDDENDTDWFLALFFSFIAIGFMSVIFVSAVGLMVPRYSMDGVGKYFFFMCTSGLMVYILNIIYIERMKRNFAIVPYVIVGSLILYFS